MEHVGESQYAIHSSDRVFDASPNALEIVVSGGGSFVTKDLLDVRYWSAGVVQKRSPEMSQAMVRERFYSGQCT